MRFLGFVPEEQLAAYYQGADAFLLPTRDLECFGLPVIEAMACGCTPLVTPIGGPAEVCAQNHPDLVSQENTSGSFTDLVRRFDGPVLHEAARAGDQLPRGRGAIAGQRVEPVLQRRCGALLRDAEAGGYSVQISHAEGPGRPEGTLRRCVSTPGREPAAGRGDDYPAPRGPNLVSTI